MPPRPAPAPVEAAVYYVVSEALTNVVKHAQRDRRDRHGDEADEYAVTVTIADDGVGGADPDSGTGLRGLRDRVARARRHAPHREHRAARGRAIMAEIPLEVADRRLP